MPSWQVFTTLFFKLPILLLLPVAVQVVQFLEQNEQILRQPSSCLSRHVLVRVRNNEQSQALAVHYVETLWTVTPLFFLYRHGSTVADRDHSVRSLPNLQHRFFHCFVDVGGIPFLHHNTVENTKPGNIINAVIKKYYNLMVTPPYKYRVWGFC